eukprot:CAMPEP_0167758910 /NCGR_PEP_ID=MMETSP0110_2-20121227/10733_1 /TAXON_ID=629695 /ORGANISM="Gymnochlora sp., Strain CCMP2014" /LENGTH=125 /DNA_ID=CAMNT_0007645243 /DNA_START=436 /DNA_END=813 /DNA_ORIENTATION=+
MQRNELFEEYLPEYPFLSFNLYDTYFCRFTTSPIVFHDLDKQKSELHYGSNLSTAFNPASLIYCKETGALYHPVTTKMGDLHGMLSADITQSLVDCMTVDMPSDEMALEWEGKQIPIVVENKFQV